MRAAAPLTDVHIYGVMLNTSRAESKSHYNWRSVSHYVKVSSTLWDLWPDIILSVRRLFSDSCCLVSVGRPLWREVRSVIYFYIIINNSVSTSQETQCVSATNTNRLMLFRETVAVCCEIHTKQCTECFKKRFTTLKAGVNLFRRHVQCFELS
jgi:hypothetical protein